jgi:dTDP-4-amino-4,6-dideoxygalactose transaminase
MVSRPIPYPVPAEPQRRLASLPKQAAAGPLSVLRPRLPAAADLLPYLATIDERRWYANYGPLVAELEQRLGLHLGTESVVTTVNGTLGLTAALLAREVPAGSLCLMPAWTFPATPHAARAAGLTPWFHDVDRHTWALDPEAVGETLLHPAKRHTPIRAVVVVSPFGAPLDPAAWEALEERTGVRVVMDAAAGFDTVRAGRIPTVVSLHATKILGAGEGGFVITTDRRMRDRIRTCCNFGFAGSRVATLPALNAKMSEYHAAVALAGLDGWTALRARHARITNWYRRGISRLEGISLQPGYGNGWVSSTTNVLLPPDSATRTAWALQRLGIETRAWWEQGCHVQPAFADCPRGDLPVTEELGGRVLGLPHFPDMQKRQVDAVVDALAQVQIAGTLPRRRLA